MINANKKTRESSLHDIHPLNQLPDPVTASNTRLNFMGPSHLSKVFPGSGSITHNSPLTPPSMSPPVVDPGAAGRLPPSGARNAVPKQNPFFTDPHKISSAGVSFRDSLFESKVASSLDFKVQEDAGENVDTKILGNFQRSVKNVPPPILAHLRRTSVSNVPLTPTCSVPPRASELDPRFGVPAPVHNDAMLGGLDWIMSQPLSQVSLSSLSMWKKTGSKGRDAAQPKFCDLTIYSELQILKTFYYKLNKHHSQDARSRCNPYELIGNGIFQNRAGMKLANIDADLEFSLSDPRNHDGSHAVGGSDILYFVDICAGPGGFSEYILHRRGIDCKGFGISLRNPSELDFNLREIKAGPVECFEAYYGHTNDGNVYDPANVKSFIHLVLKSTDNLGVQLALADGGLEVRGQELNQESLCKQLYLSQFLIALNVLREKGTFVCKLFETNSLFSIGLIYLMHLCFDKMTIYKPRMSRPQNSERYMICKNKRSGIEPIIKYFNECHQLMWEWATKKELFLAEFDIHELVPIEILQKPGFSEKMNAFNTTIAKNQLISLRRLKKYVENPLLKDESQERMRMECFEEWKIPVCNDRQLGQRNGQHCSEMTEETFERLWVGANVEVDELKEKNLVLPEFDSVFKSPYDWRVIVVQGNAANFKESRGFYMGQGGGDVFRYNFSRREWEEAPITIELPKDTLVFGECVMEFQGYGSHQKRSRVFHLIDGLVINGKDVRQLHYIARHEILTRLAKSVNKASRNDLAVIRAKQLVRMENIEDVLERCQMQELRGESGMHWTCPIDHTDERSPIIKAAGILFLKLTKDPWVMALSKSSNRKYWFNQNNGSSVYTVPATAVSNFFDTMQYRVMWQWTSETNLDVPDDESCPQPVNSLATKNKCPDAVHSVHFLDYLRKYFRPAHGEPKTPK